MMLFFVLNHEAGFPLQGQLRRAGVFRDRTGVAWGRHYLREAACAASEVAFHAARGASGRVGPRHGGHPVHPCKLRDALMGGVRGLGAAVCLVRSRLDLEAALLPPGLPFLLNGAGSCRRRRKRQQAEGEPSAAAGALSFWECFESEVGGGRGEVGERERSTSSAALVGLRHVPEAEAKAQLPCCRG